MEAMRKLSIESFVADEDIATKTIVQILKGEFPFFNGFTRQGDSIIWKKNDEKLVVASTDIEMLYQLYKEKYGYSNVKGKAALISSLILKIYDIKERVYSDNPPKTLTIPKPSVKLPREDGHFEWEYQDEDGKNIMAIPYWAPNGWNSMYISDGFSREHIIKTCVELMGDTHFKKARIIKDDECGIIIQMTTGYEFKGMRETHTIYVERKGLFVDDTGDEEDKEVYLDNGGYSGTFFVEVG